MLFDLLFDPNEARNLVDVDRSRLRMEEIDAIGDMRARLDRWMRATEDPLLRGPVPLPPGRSWS